MPRNTDPAKALLTALALPPAGMNVFLQAASAQAQIVKAVMRYQIEALGFLKHRMEQDLRLVDNLVESGGRGDSLEVVSDFVEIAASEYAGEAEKVARMSSKLASEAALQMKKTTASAIEDVAARTVA
jgi:hypothetical protein